MLAISVFSALAAVCYAYAGYPILLWCLKRCGISAKSGEHVPAPASVSIIITARNEESHIAAKLENTLALVRETSRPCQVIVALDHSDDETEKVVAVYSEVLLVKNTSHPGKEHAQRTALAQATGEMLIFTDAKTELNPDAIARFAEHFCNASVGAVSSVDDMAGGSGEGLYVKYEMMLRRLESAVHSLVGLSGSCFAVRRELTSVFRSDVPSDFALLLEAMQAGYRGVLAEDVPCRYQSTSSGKREFQRKVRTVLRGITTLIACRECLNISRFGFFAWQLISHKLFRWLVPWFLIWAFFGAALLAPTSSVFAVLLSAMILSSALVALGLFVPALENKLIIKIPLFFTLSNAAIFVAWCKYFSGQRSVAWEPTARDTLSKRR